MYAIENRVDSEGLIEFASLNQLTDLRLQDKQRKPKFPAGMKKVFEPVTDTVKHVSKDVTKTMMDTSKENSKGNTNLKEKDSEVNNARV